MMQTAAQTTLTLPVMGCGTWAWGNRLLWGYEPEMDAELQQVFDYCVAQGVTLFDTGDSYGTGRLSGQSEKLLGRFTADYVGANRERICLATKLAAYPWRVTPGLMVQAGRASAERLGGGAGNSGSGNGGAGNGGAGNGGAGNGGAGKGGAGNGLVRPLDLVQLHWSTANYAPWQEGALLDGLAQLVQQGLARGVGLSNFGPKRLRWAQRRLADQGVAITALQVQYSLLSTYPVTELGLKEVCDELGIRLIAYSPLCLGLLTGKYGEQGPFPKGLRGILVRQMLPGMKGLLAELRAIATTHSKTPAQVALNWCIAKGTIPIPGAKTIAQAEENLGALGWQLGENEVEALDRAAAACPKKMVQNIFQSR